MAFTPEEQKLIDLYSANGVGGSGAYNPPDSATLARTTADIQNQYTRDTAKIQDLYSRYNNIISSPNPGDKTPGALTQANAYKTEADQLLARIKANAVYSQFGVANFAPTNYSSAEQAQQQQTLVQANANGAVLPNAASSTMGQQVTAAQNAKPPVQGGPSGISQPVDQTQQNQQQTQANQGLQAPQLQQFKQGNTWYGYDPKSGYLVAFASADQLKQYFPNVDTNAPPLPAGVNTAAANATPGQIVSMNNASSGGTQQGSVSTGTGETRSVTGQVVPTTPTVTPDLQAQTQQILSQYGINSSSANQSDPVKYVQDIYNQVYGQLGVSAAKTQLETINKSLLDLRNTKADDASKINDDPWLTEGERLKRIGKLEEKYGQKEANLLASLQLTQGIYESGIQQSQFVASQALNIYQGQQDFNRQLALDAVNFNQQLQLNSIQRAQDMADARFKLANGQPFYKYAGNDTAYDTKTGLPVSYEQYKAGGGIGVLGQNGAFADIFEIQSGDQGAIKAQILSMMDTYKDAGILPTDSLDTATQKLQRSRIYQDQVRGPVGSGGGGTTVVGANGQSYKLTNQQIDNISPVANAFRQEQIVKNYSTIAEGYNFAKGLSNSTNNPADDQGLIYAFAKIMDPNSVVREGEYNTVQKYSQSWVKAYGKSVEQAVAGTGFLSQQARENIKKTLESRYLVSQQNYNNLFNEYAKKVETVGQIPAGNGSSFLTNYAGAYNPVGPEQPLSISSGASQTGSQGGLPGGLYGSIKSFLFGNY